MKRIWQGIALIGLCGITCAAAYLVTPKQPTPAPAAPLPLRIDPDQLDLGQVWENEADPRSFTIHNDGPTEIKVESLSSSCSCVGIEPRQFTVPAAGSIVVKAVFNHTVKQQVDGSLSIGLTATVKHPNLKTELRAAWQLTGSVRRVLIVGRALPLKRQSDLATLQPWSFSLDSAEPLTELTAECDVPELSVRVVAVGDRGREFQLIVTPPQRLTPREIEGKITLVPNSRRYGLLPTRTVRIKGEIAQDASVVPGEVLIPGRLVGEAAEETLTVTSLTGRDWRIESAATEGDGLSAEPIGTNVVRLRQIVRRVGQQTNSLTLQLRCENDRATLLVPVSYTGFQPASEK